MILNFWFNQSISAILGFIISFISGLTKEFYDLRIKKTIFNWRDVKCTTIGGLVPTILFVVFDIIYFYSKP